MIIIRNIALFILLVSVIPCSSLNCFECGCTENNLSACNCGVITTSTENDYCVIMEQRYAGETYVQLSRVPRNASWIYIQDPYFMLTQESIRYNVSTQQWSLWTRAILFGCDWDNCNHANLIAALPNSFKLNISTNWLNTNIYGNGSVSSCYVCDTEVCGNTSNPANFSQCPMTTCNNVSSCLAYDLWNNLETGEQCFQAQCAPTYLDEEVGDNDGGKYRVEVESIVYLARDRTKYDIWEIDVYCAVRNCTRPTIFQEVVQQLKLEIGDLSQFPMVRPSTTQAPPTTTSTPIQNPLRCYSCDCFNQPNCDCSSTVISSLDYTYCVIVRELFGQDDYIYADYLELDATLMYIQEFPYALVEESIDYKENTGLWLTTTNFIVYGCNWNLCNKPSLIPLLPNSFQMRLPEAWLNSSILGTGQPVRSCHECPEEAQCGTIDFLNASTCPVKPCNTTCLVIDTYDDPEYNYLCYQSFCLPPDTEDYQLDRHRIEIEGIIYASQQNVVHLWEVDIYCRADDCSRPGIFKELYERLTIQTGTLSTLFNETHDPNIPQRRCYDCYCFNQPNCPCNRTTIMSANQTYCLLMRENYGQDTWISMGHLDEDSTRVHIRDFPYLLVEESILYDEQLQRWDTITNFVVYGCNWDYCNHPSLIPYMPTSFQMRLPDAWLNTNVLGTGQPVRNCHECPEAPQCGTLDFLDPSRCPIKECNTTCLVFDVFDDPAVDQQCYQSFCAPPDSDEYHIDTHRVEIEGILYLHKPSREVEIWEIDLYCRADDCSRPEIFTELKEQLTVQIGDLGPFDNISSTTSPMSSTTRPTGTNPSSTNPSQTTTATTPRSKASILTNLNIYLILFVSIILFNFH